MLLGEHSSSSEECEFRLQVQNTAAMNKSVVKLQVTIPGTMNSAEAVLLPQGQLQKAVLNSSRPTCDSMMNIPA